LIGGPGANVIERVGFIGGGVMAEAIVRGLLANGLVQPGQVVASDPLDERRIWLAEQYQVETTTDNWRAARDATLVVLAVKPQQMADALRSLHGRLAPEQLVVSIAAGIPARVVGEGLRHEHIARVMPNTPAQIGAGMSVWTTTERVADAPRAQVRALLQTLGREVFVHDERYLDMATAINGSGPAYVFLFIEALIDAGVHIGLARPLAEELAIQTVLGAAQMVRETGKHPAALKNMVTSPGGTTAAGLFALEDGRLRAIIDRAVVAAYERSKEFGK
jgi:pyrroline-5-carboxylate reductase